MSPYSQFSIKPILLLSFPYYCVGKTTNELVTKWNATTLQTDCILSASWLPKQNTFESLLYNFCMRYNVRPASRKELDVIVDWAAKEGWNPGLHDGDAFYAADPNGFYLGFLGDEPIASISAVAYNDTFGFIGFYIVKPEFRGDGYGLKLWNESLNHLPTQNIGLDGVIEQQENYKKSGFKLAYRNIRYEGVGTGEDFDHTNIVALSDVSFEQVLDYDKNIFPTKREAFLIEWIKQPESLSLAYLKNEMLLGYGMVRKCRKGFKVGPLLADDPEVAEMLFQKTRAFIGKDSPIYLDTPEVNQESVKLAEKFKMKPMFETARMYTKEEPRVDLNKVFGVTTFELG